MQESPYGALFKAYMPGVGFMKCVPHFVHLSPILSSIISLREFPPSFQGLVLTGTLMNVTNVIQRGEGNFSLTYQHYTQVPL